MTAATGGVLLVDHLNINHEAGRHDLVRAFYFDLLGCAVDPRKADNLEKGRKGLWANAGINQFHLSEGATAQVFDGIITLAFANLAPVRERLANPPAALTSSQFGWRESASSGDELLVTDPWGSVFRLVQDASFSDPRGTQPGGASEPLGLVDLLIHVPRRAGLDGIVRFYTRVLRCPAELVDDGRRAVVHVGGGQTLSFAHRPGDDDRPVAHEEISEDEHSAPINNGAHVSLYVADLPAAYQAADQLGVLFVNHRFSRRANTLDEAVEQCMFRILDVVDPDAPANGPSLRLEHEVRACVKRDGSKYKSCPLHEVPEECVAAVQYGP
jgi:catechol 2,3-dioxygenase-like lactoylglutathione lyase family enzyme